MGDIYANRCKGGHLHTGPRHRAAEHPPGGNFVQNPGGHSELSLIHICQKDRVTVAALTTDDELFTNVAELLDEGFNQSTAMLILYYHDAYSFCFYAVFSANLDSECIFKGTSVKQLVQYALSIFSIVW